MGGEISIAFLAYYPVASDSIRRKQGENITRVVGMGDEREGRSGKKVER